MKTIQKAICHLQSISFGKMCICNSEITEEKTIWGFKGQMLPVKHCPYSNEAPGAVFWSERLKWVQWIAQAVISHIRKVTLFKKGTLSPNEGLLGLHVTFCTVAPHLTKVQDHNWRLWLNLQVLFQDALPQVHFGVDLYILISATNSPHIFDSLEVNRFLKMWNANVRNKKVPPVWL